MRKKRAMLFEKLFLSSSSSVWFDTCWKTVIEVLKCRIVWLWWHGYDKCQNWTFLIREHCKKTHLIQLENLSIICIIKMALQVKTLKKMKVEMLSYWSYNFSFYKDGGNAETASCCIFSLILAALLLIYIFQTDLMASPAIFININDQMNHSWINVSEKDSTIMKE